MRFHAFWLPTYLCDGVWCKNGGGVDVEGCGRLDVAWFCVCKLGGSLAGDEWKLSGGGWCKCECVGRQKGLYGSCLIRFTSIHCLKSIRMFEDDVTWPEHALVIPGGYSRWFVERCIIWRMFAFFGLSQYILIRALSVFFSFALTVNVIGLLFLRQCLNGLPPSTEISISGTWRKLPLCLKVSQHV